MNANGEEKSSGLGLGQLVKKVWGLTKHITAERVQAGSTLLIALDNKTTRNLYAIKALEM